MRACDGHVEIINTQSLQSTVVNAMEMTLNKAKELVKELVKKQGFPHEKNALSQKLLWAFVELGEASDSYKKGKEWNVVVEELMDVLFYILDFVGIVEDAEKIELNLDRIFLNKWKINMKRPEKYGQSREI